MAHVNAEKTVASQIKSVAGAGSAKMMDSAMGKMDMGSMMKGGMGPMMAGGMGPMMAGMGPMMKSPGVATGVAVTAGSSAGRSVIRKFFTHPLVIFGLGVAVGCYVYKYRKSIISTTEEAQEE
ncbi:MAG: hypothetical protein CG441_1946 [Methylococcaceae bacterium NSM2-1]|nr:MAG: hypothetical protein CG441_1946 [Methylococcaceae bacterium NSM2-1]